MSGKNGIYTVRELYLYMEGQFDAIQERLRNLNCRIDEYKKFAFWVGGMSGAIVGGLIIVLFKTVVK